MRPDGNGDVTDTHVAWSFGKGVPERPSPVLVDDLLLMVNDGGVATCVDARTGEPAWVQRIGGKFRASPIHADGRIYMFDMDGRATVIAADRKYRRLAENHLDHGCQASPAVGGDRLYVRTTDALVCIGEK